jgi:hypothetical protein
MLYLIREQNRVYATQSADILNKNKNNVKVWKQVIKLREPILSSEYLTIIDLQQHNTAKKPYNLEPEYIYNTSILKSNLQKTMRRQYIVQCLSTTLQLLKQDTAELLRRLPVIILEDTQYNHYTYTHLIWLMIAHSKGYTLTEQDVQLIMDATATALMSDYRYDLQLEPTETQKYPECITSYIAIQLRAIYGGLKGDQAFLKRLALRSVDFPDIPEEKKSQLFEVDLKKIEPFNPICHIIQQAIDFHCCPYLLEHIQELEPDIKEVKEVIWWHWSSPNRRLFIDDTIAKSYETEERDKTLEDYKKIKHYLREFARKQIRYVLVSHKEYVRQKTIKDYFL